MSGLFGSLFDLNHDGEMDAFERTMEFMAINEIMSDPEDAGLDPDDYDF